MKSLYTNQEIVAIFETLWERRTECVAQFFALTGLWGGGLFIFWYMWAVSGAAVSGLVAVTAFVAGELALAGYAWYQMRGIDRLANDVLGHSQLAQELLK